MPASLKSRLPAIAAELRPRVSAAVKVGAEQVAEGAKGRVHVNSGDLREAIHVERDGPASYAVVAGNEDVFYGHMEEFGTTHSAPHPFLVPALEQEKDRVVGLVAESLRRL